MQKSASVGNAYKTETIDLLWAPLPPLIRSSPRQRI